MSSGELPASACLSTSAAAAFGSNRAARSPRIRSLPETDAAFLVVGDRTPGDEVIYPDIDLELKAGPDGVKAFCHKDGSPYPKIERT